MFGEPNILYDSTLCLNLDEQGEGICIIDKNIIKKIL